MWTEVRERPKLDGMRSVLLKNELVAVLGCLFLKKMKTGKPQANSQTAHEDRLSDRGPTHILEPHNLYPAIQWAQEASIPL